MSTLGRTRLRLAADTASFDTPLDVLRRATPQFWRGNDVQFEIAVFFNGALQDVSSVASLTLEIRPMGANGGPPDPSFTPLMGATISSFDNTTSLDNWNAGSKQHALVAFTAAQSNIAAGAAWLSIFAITNDSPGRVITLCAGPVRVLEDGAGLATTPTPAADTFYTTEQSDARFAPIGAGGDGAPAGTSNPLMDGAAAPGSSTSYSRADHVHPTDTSRAAAAHASQHASGGSDPVTLAQSQVTGLASALAALAPLASPGLSGTPTAPTVSTATDSSTKVATTAFVQAAIAAAGGGGGGSWGSITGTLSSQTDLASALSAKAPLASPTFTGTPLAPTVSGTSDSTTKIATTAFVQAVAALSLSNPMSALGDIIYGGASGATTRLAGNTTTTQKILAQTGNGTVSAAPAWVAFPFTVDGSSNIIFNGSTALKTQKNSGGLFDAGVSFYGSLAAQSADGTLHKFSASNVGDVVLVQNNNATGQSAIDFMSAASGSGSGISNGAIYGAVGFDYQVGAGFPSNGRMYLSFSPPFILNSDGTVTNPSSGVGECVLQQEGIIGGAYKATEALAFLNDWSMRRQDPSRNEQFRMYGAGNSGYYDTTWTQQDDSHHYWGTPQGLTLRMASSESKEAFFSIRTAAFSVGTIEAFGPSRACLGTNSTDGLSIAAADASGGYIRFFTGGYAAAKERLKVTPAGEFVASNVVTSDLSATLANSQYQFTIYDNSGTAVFKIRYKDGSGTVKTGTVALS